MTTLDNAAAKPTAIAFEHVHKGFHSKTGYDSVLKDVSAAVGAGSIVTVVGPSGAGKSTLLSLCNLLESVDEGVVRIFDTPVDDWDIRNLRHTVGLVFQTPTVLPGTVADNLTLAAKLSGSQLTNREEHLRRVGLHPDLLNKNAEDLSGGQKQRIAIARTLVQEPQILLLDEITSALDVASASEVEDLMLELQHQFQLTLFWVTHNLEQARRVGTETWLMVDGRLVEQAPTEQFFTSPQRDLTRDFLAGRLVGGVTS